MRRTMSSVVVVTLIAILVAFVVPPTLAAPQHQTPKILNVGVIDSFDGPTAEGVTLAFQRFMAQGPFTIPDGTGYTLNVVTANAATPKLVADAVTQLMKSNVVAIFAPSDNQFVEQSLPALQAAGVPIFSAATSTAISGGRLFFRTRASDNWRSAAMADYLLTDLKKTSIAIYQGTDDVKDAVTAMVATLSQRGKTPAPAVIPSSTGTSDDSAKALIASSPDTVIAFGLESDTAELYGALRNNGYKGVFFTPNAASSAFINATPESLRAGVYGVVGWSYASDQPDSADFLRDYVALFGSMPTALSASAYDTAVALAIAIKNGGITPDGIHDALLKLAKAKSLEGFFNPALGNNDLTASVTITVTNKYGAPVVLARYEDTGRVAVSNAQATAYPSTTPTASATPQGVVATAKNTVNVRTGPGDTYPVIGQLKKGEQAQLVGASTDLQWYVIDFRAQQGWINATFVTVFGDARTLPIVAAPPTPIPSQTALPSSTPPAPPTVTMQPFPDIVMINAVMNPPSPTSGQPFTLSVTVQNQGTVDAGSFAVATSFMPGNVYSAQNVGGLQAGAQTTVNLPGTVNGTGTFTIEIVLDLNNQVSEGPNGEANNKPQFTYTVH